MYRIISEPMMAYQNPNLVKSPKGAVTHLRVLWDGGEQLPASGNWGGWSIAEIGNPQSRGNATWFILPKPLQDAIRARLKDAPDPDRARELTRGAAEAS